MSGFDMTGGSTTCGACGTTLGAADVLYDAQGRVVCSKCQMAQSVEEARDRAATTFKRRGWAGLSVGMVSFFFNPYLSFSVLAVLNAGWVWRTLAADADYRKRLGKAAMTLKVGADVGAALGVVSAALDLLDIWP